MPSLTLMHIICGGVAIIGFYVIYGPSSSGPTNSRSLCIRFRTGQSVFSLNQLDSSFFFSLQNVAMNEKGTQATSVIKKKMMILVSRFFAIFHSLQLPPVCWCSCIGSFLFLSEISESVLTQNKQNQVIHWRFCLSDRNIRIDSYPSDPKGSLIDGKEKAMLAGQAWKALKENSMIDVKYLGINYNFFFFYSDSGKS